MPIEIQYNKTGNLGFIEPNSVDEPWGTYIGTRCGLKVYAFKGRQSCEVLALDHNRCYRNNSARPRIAMELSLSKEGNAWEIDIVKVARNYKGQSLAPRVYCLLMKKLTIVLKAGSSQSVGGRKLWNRLAKRSDVLVWCKPSKYSKKKTLAKTGKAQLTTDEFDLYSSSDSTTEMFAIAV